MKKTMAVIMGILISSQALADNWNERRHGHRPNYHSDSVYNKYNNHYGYYNHGYNNHNGYKHYNHSRGQWRHTNHNGRLAWWFVVGSMFYLSEQAYLNDIRNSETVIINPLNIYNSPNYIEQRVYSTPSYRPNYGWYCEQTGRFSQNSYDTCPRPWISRQY